jgi:hypothetical protein
MMMQTVMSEQTMYMRPIRKVPTRPITPELVETPAPSGKYRNFMEYAKQAVTLAGTAQHLGQLMGFTGGTRISDWIRGRGGRPSVSSCLKLAELTDDNPLDVLVMAGYAEEAELLKKFGLNTDPPGPAVSFHTRMRMLEAATTLDALSAEMKSAIKKIEES